MRSIILKTSWNTTGSPVSPHNALNICASLTEVSARQRMVQPSLNMRVNIVEMKIKKDKGHMVVLWRNTHPRWNTYRIAVSPSLVKDPSFSERQVPLVTPRELRDALAERVGDTAARHWRVLRSILKAPVEPPVGKMALSKNESDKVVTILKTTIGAMCY